MNKKLFNKSDLILITGLLSAALLISLAWSFYNGDAVLEAHIIVNGADAEIIDIYTDSIFSIPERPSIIFEVKNGAIAFISSDCPDKVCVHTGFIRYGGQFAACLPSGVVLRIITRGKMGADDIDTITS